MLPPIRPFVYDALLDCENPVFILVGDECHVPIAKSSMEQQLSLSIHRTLLGDEIQDSYKKNDHHDLFQKGRGGAILLSPRNGGQGHVGILKDILSIAPQKSLVHLIHSDISTLQTAKALFGDDRPRLGMFGKCVISPHVRFKLSLLSTCSGLKQQNEAEMDPWLNLLHEFELVEALTSKIVTWD